MTLQILLLLLGFAALYFGADWTVRGAARLEGSLGLSPIVIGLTVVSLGTSAPELVVAVLATLQGSGDLAVGNILGSNLANIGLILGATAMIRPLIVLERVVKREIPIMLALTLFLYVLLRNGSVGRLDGVVLLLLLAAYLVYVFRLGRDAPVGIVTGFPGLDLNGRLARGKAALRDVGLLVAGALGLLIGGKAIVQSATYIASAVGVSEMVIGLTVVAIGTSLPELATSLMAAARKQTDIAVGNIIGSNIFNIAGVLGVAGLINPIQVPASVLRVEFPAVLLISALVFMVPLFPGRDGRYRIRRWEGVVLFCAYLGVGLWVFY